MTRRLLLDISSLMYRAYYALPHTITDARGRPVNALHGYLDITATLIQARRPDECVHVYDADWRPAERVAAFDGYKAHRLHAVPDDLTSQFEQLPTVLDALGLPQAEAEGWEAETRSAPSP